LRFLTKISRSEGEWSFSCAQLAPVGPRALGHAARARCLIARSNLSPDALALARLAIEFDDAHRCGS